MSRQLHARNIVSDPIFIMSVEQRTLRLRPLLRLHHLVVVDVQENRLEDYAALTDAGLNVLALDVVSLETMNVDLQRLAEAVDHEHPVDEVPQVVPLNQRAFVPFGGGHGCQLAKTHSDLAFSKQWASQYLL